MKEKIGSGILKKRKTIFLYFTKLYRYFVYVNLCIIFFARSREPEPLDRLHNAACWYEL